MKRIGPSFWDELVAAGLAGINMSWSDNGQFTFGDDMTQQQKATVTMVLATHVSPPPPPPRDLTAEELAAHGIGKGTITQAEIDAIKDGR